MFGISFFEFVIIFTILILIVKPKDLPELIKKTLEFFYKSRDYFSNIKAELSQFSQNIGFDDIKNEVENNFNEEKIKNITNITDLYGQKHNINDENPSAKS